MDLGLTWLIPTTKLPSSSGSCRRLDVGRKDFSDYVHISDSGTNGIGRKIDGNYVVVMCGLRVQGIFDYKLCTDHHKRHAGVVIGYSLVIHFSNRTRLWWQNKSSTSPS